MERRFHSYGEDTNPCYNCSERYRACQDSCKKRDSWLQKRREVMAAIFNNIQLDRIIRDNETRRFTEITKDNKKKQYERSKRRN